MSTSTGVSKWKLGRHKHKHKHKKNGQVRSSCACAYAYVVALTSENGVDITTSISTRPWINHRPLWPRPHANISKAIWRTLRSPSCFLLGWGELVSRIESNMPLCLCLCASKNQASGIKRLTMPENPQFIIHVALCNRAQVHVFKNPSYYQVRRAILCFPCSHHKTKF